MRKENEWLLIATGIPDYYRVNARRFARYALRRLGHYVRQQDYYVRAPPGFDHRSFSRVNGVVDLKSIRDVWGLFHQTYESDSDGLCSLRIRNLFDDKWRRRGQAGRLSLNVCRYKSV